MKQSFRQLSYRPAYVNKNELSAQLWSCCGYLTFDRCLGISHLQTCHIGDFPYCSSANIMCELQNKTSCFLFYAFILCNSVYVSYLCKWGHFRFNFLCRTVHIQAKILLLLTKFLVKSSHSSFTFLQSIVFWYPWVLQ